MILPRGSVYQNRGAHRTRPTALLGLKPAATNTLVSITIPSILRILSVLAKGPRTRALGANSDRDDGAPLGFFLGSVKNEDPVGLLKAADAHHQCLEWVKLRRIGTGAARPVNLRQRK
jgi:hypothetical protein